MSYANNDTFSGKDLFSKREKLQVCFHFLKELFKLFHAVLSMIIFIVTVREHRKKWKSRCACYECHVYGQKSINTFNNSRSYRKKIIGV